MPNFIKTLWSDAIIKYLYENVNLSANFDRSLESYVRSQGGNKITIPMVAANGSIIRTDNLSVGAGLPLAITDIDKSAIELAIYEFTYGPILIRKIDEVQSNQALFEMARNEIGQAFVEKIFTDAMTHIITNVDASHKLQWTGGVAGAAFSYSDLKAMRKKLNQAKILQDGRLAAIDCEAEDTLSSDDYLKNWFAVNQAAIQNGQLPNLAGFSFNPSTLIPLTTKAGAIDADPANNVKYNVITWRKNHMHLVIQTEMEITQAEDPKYLGVVASFTNRYGFLLDRAKGAVQSTQQ